MRRKTKQLLALSMTLVMCFAMFSSVSISAEGTSERTVIAQETFDGGTINNSAGATNVLNAGGFWFGDSNGSQYTLEDNTLRYTVRDGSDITDIRFWHDKDAQAAERALLQDDFTLSFRLKPLVPSLDMWINWTEQNTYVNDQGETKNRQTWEDGVRLSAGVLHGRALSDADRQKAEIPLNQWSVIEISFKYDDTATAYSYPDQEQRTGAFTSYTVRLNGMELGTAEANVEDEDKQIKCAFHCIDFFRLFQGASGCYELDDLTLVSGAEPYNTNWDQSQEDYLAATKVFYDKTPVNPDDYAYSMAIVGDTQIVCQNDALYDENGMDTIYQWIVDNKESKNIQYVLGMGDITQKSTDKEWEIAMRAINKLNGVVPYSMLRGNHDTKDSYNKSTNLNNSTYKSQFDGFFSTDAVQNSYRLMTIGETKYLFITLDYGPSDAVLEWAGELCETYFDYRVIITTHAYLHADGTTVSAHDPSDPISDGKLENNGETMWQKLIRKYENIYLVLSGHECSDRVIVTQTEGAHGNIVTQMLIDFQGVDTAAGYGSTGIVNLFYFSEDGSEIEVETYSTIYQAYYREVNQFTVEIPLLQSETSNGSGETPYIGENGNWWIGDTDTGVKAAATDGKDGKDGADGKDGLTPYIGENGNWWIGDADTGVKAQAEASEQNVGCMGTLAGGAVWLLCMLAAAVALIFQKRKHDGRSVC